MVAYHSDWRSCFGITVCHFILGVGKTTSSCVFLGIGVKRGVWRTCRPAMIPLGKTISLVRATTVDVEIYRRSYGALEAVLMHMPCLLSAVINSLASESLHKQQTLYLTRSTTSKIRDWLEVHKNEL